MLQDAYAIGVSAMAEARALTDDKIKEGVAGWMHIAEKAIGEIVRLTPMCGTLDDKDSIFRGVDFNLPEYDKSLDNN